MLKSELRLKMAFIQVVESENSSEILEMPLEEDQTLLEATLVSQFPGAIGLRYKADSGAWRAVKASGTSFIHPGGEWALDAKYVVTYGRSDNDYGNKRKGGCGEMISKFHKRCLSQPNFRWRFPM